MRCHTQADAVPGPRQACSLVCPPFVRSFTHAPICSFAEGLLSAVSAESALGSGGTAVTKPDAALACPRKRMIRH